MARLRNVQQAMIPSRLDRLAAAMINDANRESLFFPYARPSITVHVFLTSAVHKDPINK